jgi:ABC exporter DevB family membrane fusion protein
VINGVVAAAPATIEPASRVVQVASDRTGTIKEILVKPGDPVAAGQRLIQLDDDEARSMVSLRTAELQVAKAALADMLAGTRPERKAEAEAQATEAQARLDRAQFEFDRVKQLLEHNAVGAADFRAVQETLGVAKGEVQRTLALLELAKNGPTATEIERARAAVAQAQANLDVAQTTLERRVIPSPVTGRVLYIHLEPGEVVSDMVLRPIMSLAAAGNPRLRAEVDEIDISRVHVGQPIIAVADSFPDRQYRGTVIRLENLMGRRNVRTGRPTEQQDTRVREVLIELDATAADLPVDLLMTVRFLEDKPAPTQK